MYASNCYALLSKSALNLIDSANMMPLDCRGWRIWRTGKRTTKKNNSQKIQDQ